jgi:DNA invertase Pin-like site-specific DNA recombinase
MKWAGSVRSTDWASEPKSSSKKRLKRPCSNDRLVLGLKGAMSEAELHSLRERLKGGVR